MNESQMGYNPEGRANETPEARRNRRIRLLQYNDRLPSNRMSEAINAHRPPETTPEPLLKPLTSEEYNEMMDLMHEEIGIEDPALKKLNTDRFSELNKRFQSSGKTEKDDAA